MLHDNALPNPAASTVEVIRHMRSELLPNPTLSPNLAPSDYYMSGPLKGAFRGRRFVSGDEVWTRCIRGFHQNRKLFPQMGRAIC